MDGFVGPLAGQAELSPGANVLLRPACRRGGPFGTHPRAGALGAEDAVDLIEREASERIALVNHEHQSRCRALRIVIRPVGELDLQGRVPECALERFQRRMPCAVAHEAHVGLPRDEPRERLRGIDQVRLQTDVTLPTFPPGTRAACRRCARRRAPAVAGDTAGARSSRTSPAGTAPAQQGAGRAGPGPSWSIQLPALLPQRVRGER